MSVLLIYVIINKLKIPFVSEEPCYAIRQKGL